MAYYYKIGNLKRTIDLAQTVEADLKSFLAEQNFGKSSVYRRKILTNGLDILYEGREISNVEHLVIVSDPELPSEFLYRWGEVSLGPNEITRAEYQFRLVAASGGSINDTFHILKMLVNPVVVQMFRGKIPGEYFHINYPRIPISFNGEDVLGSTSGLVREILSFHKRLKISAESYGLFDLEEVAINFK